MIEAKSKAIRQVVGHSMAMANFQNKTQNNQEFFQSLKENLTAARNDFDVRSPGTPQAMQPISYAAENINSDNQTYKANDAWQQYATSSSSRSEIEASAAYAKDNLKTEERLSGNAEEQFVALRTDASSSIQGLRESTYATNTLSQLQKIDLLDKNLKTIVDDLKKDPNINEEQIEQLIKDNKGNRSGTVIINDTAVAQSMARNGTVGKLQHTKDPEQALINIKGLKVYGHALGYDTGLNANLETNLSKLWGGYLSDQGLSAKEIGSKITELCGYFKGTGFENDHLAMSKILRDIGRDNNGEVLKLGNLAEQVQEKVNSGDYDIYKHSTLDKIRAAGKGVKSFTDKAFAMVESLAKHEGSEGMDRTRFNSILKELGYNSSGEISKVVDPLALAITAMNYKDYQDGNLNTEQLAFRFMPAQGADNQNAFQGEYGTNIGDVTRAALDRSAVALIVTPGMGKESFDFMDKIATDTNTKIGQVHFYHHGSGSGMHSSGGAGGSITIGDAKRISLIEDNMAKGGNISLTSCSTCSGILNGNENIATTLARSTGADTFGSIPSTGPKNKVYGFELDSGAFFSASANYGGQYGGVRIENEDTQDLVSTAQFEAKEKNEVIKEFSFS